MNANIYCNLKFTPKNNVLVYCYVRHLVNTPGKTLTNGHLPSMNMIGLAK